MGNELEAMNTIKESLSDLEEKEIRRVVSWILAWSKDEHNISMQEEETQERNSKKNPAEKNSIEHTQYEDIADFYYEISPSTDAEKILAVGYWFQEVQGQPALDARSINSELKDLGYGVGNVTRAFTDLASRKPSLAMQTAKSGSSKQARKKYRITREGIRQVERMVSGETSNEA